MAILVLAAILVIGAFMAMPHVKELSEKWPDLQRKFKQMPEIFGKEKKPEEKAPPAKPVQTAQAVKKDVPIYIDSFGTLNSFYSVDILSQVTGQIQSAHFESGAEVKQGDILFNIDPSQYKAQLKEAKAALTEDIVSLKLKKTTLERNRPLLAKQFISKQAFDEYQADVDSLIAKIEIDKANIEQAKINLDYCSIKSPIDGVAGNRQVDPGNIVIANSQPVLVNIKNIDHLYVYFSIPERELPRTRQALDAQKLKVRIIVEGDEGKAHEGEVDFIDNTVDDTTGTITMRANVPNKERDLWPGQFVTVRLILSTEKDAILVPYEAVQLGQKGPYAFVISSDNKADLRQVTVGDREDDEIIIEKGIKEGEKVVTVGQLGLSPGVVVQDVTQKAAQETPQQPAKKSGEKVS
jgi:multidrug efflux system membrane fusion protein